MLRLPAHLLEATFRALCDCGQGQCECVVFWTGPAGALGVVDGWEHPIHHRSPYGYEVEDSWLTRYWFQLGRERRAIQAQVHTHPGAAFHSRTDDLWPVVSQPGFVSIVIPNFACGTVGLEHAWAGYLTAEGRWQRAPISSTVEVIR